MGETHGSKKQVRRTHPRCDGNVATVGYSRIRPASRSAKSFRQIGVNRPDWFGRDPLRCLPGGILTQLIEEVEDQLGDAEECITREKRRIVKLERRLQRLQQLQALNCDHT